MPTRTARTAWNGTLMEGGGQVELSSSGLATFDVSFPKRAAEQADGATSPEELIAAAHSACLAMNLSGVLGQEGLTADSIDVSAEVTLSTTAEGAAISGIELTLRAAVPGMEAARFAELAATAERTCPVSKALAATTITLDAALA